MRCHTLVKDLVAFPRTSRAFSTAPITSPPPSSESTCSDLRHRKRIGLIRPPIRRHAPTEVSARIEPRVAGSPADVITPTSSDYAILLTSSQGVDC